MTKYKIIPLECNHLPQIVDSDTPPDPACRICGKKAMVVNALTDEVIT